jgi:hypothetical protein
MHCSILLYQLAGKRQDTPYLITYVPDFTLCHFVHTRTIVSCHMCCNFYLQFGDIVQRLVYCYCLCLQCAGVHCWVWDSEFGWILEMGTASDPSDGRDCCAADCVC